ncbi:MAG: sulfatase [Planctomycetes bacterium]|nr:sulfatase [Planctomycetota bacterium]
MNGRPTALAALLVPLLLAACTQADGGASAAASSPQVAPPAPTPAAEPAVVAFSRVDLDGAALLERGKLWDSPNHPVDRPRVERGALAEDGTLRLRDGALLVVQLPGRVQGALELELDGAVLGGATVRLVSLAAPLAGLATADRVEEVGEALAARLAQTLVEAPWPVDAVRFAAGPFDGDRKNLWLLLSVEVAAGGAVELRGARLRERIAATPAHHSIGGESRPALPIAAGARHRFALPALPAGARVALALGLPEGMAGATPPLRATCRLSGATPAEQQIVLADGPTLDDEPLRRWREVTFTIDAARDAGAALEIALEGPAGAVVLAMRPAVHARRDAATPLDLLLISLDTLRADRVGAFGSKRGLTPNLDRFALRCVRFQRATSPANWTLPAHGSLMTGLQPLVHGAHRFGARVSIAGWPNLASACAAAGMATAAFTGGGYVDAAFGFDRGFERYQTLDALMTPRNLRYARSPRRAMERFNAALRSDVDFADVLEWGAAHADRRSFLFFHTYHAHDYAPAEATARARGLVEPAPFPSPIELQQGDLTAVQPGSAQLADYEARYDATVAEIDATLGALLDALERRGALDHTAIVITADHGEAFLEHGTLFHATGLHDEVMRVPLLIHAPGALPRDVDVPVSLIDVAPTLRELAGLPPAEACSGVSLVPLLRGEELAARPLLLQDAPASGATHSALLLGRFKYVRWTAPPREQLYDVVADPGETRDLVTEQDHAATLAQARAALERVLAQFEAEAERLAAWRAAGGVAGGDLDAQLDQMGYGR